MLGAYASNTFTCTKSFCYGEGDVQKALVRLQELVIFELTSIEHEAPDFTANGKIDGATAQSVARLASWYPERFWLQIDYTSPTNITQYAPELLNILGEHAFDAPRREPRVKVVEPDLPDNDPKLEANNPVPVNYTLPAEPVPPIPTEPIVVTPGGVPLTPVAPMITPPAPISPLTLTPGVKVALGLTIATVLASVLGVVVVRRRRRARAV